MNLQPRFKNYAGSKEILVNGVGIATETVTLDATKFTVGKLYEAGTALVVNTDTGKAEPYSNAVTGRAVLLFRDIRAAENDVQTIGLKGGYVQEDKCTGATAEFKTAAKLLYFQ